MPRGLAVAIAALITLIVSQSPTGASAATVSPLRFTDHAGNQWERWVLTDRQQEKTLLLVVENQKDSSRLPRIVYRHSFALGSRELAIQIERFQNFNDQTDSDFEFVADPDGTNAVTHALTAAQPRASLPIWTLKQDHWTLQDERDYTAWIQNTVTESFLKGSGIEVDCADLSLLLRWVYAHDHGLPAANSLSGAGGLFGQWSGTSAWDKLSTNSDWRKDARFKAALRYLLNSAYTHTILGDLYPTEISREYVTPGAIRLTITDVESGHTQVIHHVGHDAKLCPDGQCVSVFYGDTPSSETIFDDVAWLLNLKQGKGGFMRWRWPAMRNSAWSLLPATTMPGYSLDQFAHPTFNTDQYENYINTQLFWSTTLTDRATTLGYSLIQMLQARLQVTTLAYAFCYLENCPSNSSAYDDYATTVRDQRYLAAQQRFIDLVTNDAVDTDSNEYVALLAQAQKPLFAGGGFSYADYIFDRGRINELMSPDPSRAFTERWGLQSASLAQFQWANEALWEILWSTREAQVQAAQNLCYANQSSVLTCRSTDNAVKALSTDRLDRALRQVRQALRIGRPQLDNVTQAALARYTAAKKTAETGAAFCATTASGSCTISDFVYSSLPAVDRMSSRATDTFAERYGF